MDKNTAIAAAKAMIEAAGLTAEDLFPTQTQETPNPDIDALLPRNRWMPKCGDSYFYVDEHCDVSMCANGMTILSTTLVCIPEMYSVPKKRLTNAPKT